MPAALASQHAGTAGGLHMMASRAQSSPQQDRQGLPVGHLCTCLELRQGATSNGVLDRQEGISRQAQHARNIARRHLEGLGAQHHRSLAELLEANAVVQTAR